MNYWQKLAARTQELDRLYMEWDRRLFEWQDATPTRREKLWRQIRYWRRKYEALRDSRMPRKHKATHA